MANPPKTAQKQQTKVSTRSNTGKAAVAPRLIECKVILVSTSPERSDTILLENPFQYK